MISLLLASTLAYGADTWIYYNASYMTSTDVAPMKRALEGVGAEVTTSSSSSWPSSWTGYKLVIILLPNAGFSSSQASALTSFVNGGGRLVLSGDWEPGFSTYNAYVDNLLTSMGVSMSLGSTIVSSAGCGTASSITSDQVTESVSSLNISASTNITGGTALARSGSNTVLAVAQPSSASSSRTPYDVVLGGDVNLFLDSCSGSTSSGRNQTMWENLYNGICPDVDSDGYDEEDCGGDDCDDGDATIFPGADETPYDGVDDDCDGSDWTDVDGDGYDAEIVGGSDCDDSDVSTRPGATESADGADDDCDDTIDEGTSWYDDDGDGWTEAGGDCDDRDAETSPGGTEAADGEDDDCDDVIDEGTDLYDDDGDGYTEREGDCSDGDADVSPGEPEIDENGIDDDCDGVVDDGVFDPDGDGYTEEGGDCDSSDADAYPGAPETADGVDNDCDGTADEGTDDYDDDGDGVTENGGDCDDTDAGVSPSVEETDDGLDDDCDGSIDEGTDRTDDDGDGFSEDAGDCDDTDDDVAPGQDEAVDGVDNDCDGATDEGSSDLDADGYAEADGDCDDENGWMNPGLDEMCDGLDNNCDGTTDEGCDEGEPDTGVAPKSGGCSSAPGGEGRGLIGAILGVVMAALGLGRRRR